MDEPERLRLQVFLSRCGIASRRKCEEFISRGRVKVNGSVIREMGRKIDPSADKVEFDNGPVRQEEKKVYLLLNKPEGYICSNNDPYGRPLASGLVQGDFPQRLFHVGRLDFNSRGLILYTNDGNFADRVSHPSGGFEKEYLLEAGKTIDPASLEQFSTGIFIENTVYTCRSYEIISSKKVKITLVEGKNRELRRVFEYFNIPIRKLTRVRLGIVTLRGIKPGQYRHLTKGERNYFMKPEGTERW